MAINIKIGDTFNNLKVIDYISGAKRRWKCQCECGNIVYKDNYDLLKSKPLYCKTCANKNVKNWSTKHGLSNSPEYQAWADMKVRCYNSNNKRYKDYGGRGITICDSWKNSFENFYKDMGSKPSSKYSLDRIKNEGNYEPENCEWRIWEKQYNNRRPCHYLIYNNKTQTLTQWAKELNILPTTLFGRLGKSKWSIEKALTQPIKGKNK